MISVQSWSASISWVSQDIPLRKPCCLFVIILCLLRWSQIFDTIICSNSLQGMAVKEMGRSFSGSDLFPFLKIGHTVERVHESGSRPCWYDWENR